MDPKQVPVSIAGTDDGPNQTMRRNIATLRDLDASTLNEIVSKLTDAPDSRDITTQSVYMVSDGYVQQGPISTSVSNVGVSPEPAAVTSAHQLQSEPRRRSSIKEIPAGLYIDNLYN